MAEDLYKEWFVRLRFPNYKNTAFVNKNGKTVKYGTEGALPVGWKVVALEKIIAFRVDNRGRNPEYYCNTGLPVLDNHLIKNSPYVNLKKAKRFLDSNLFNNFLRKYLQPNDVLITLVGTVGNIALAPKNKCAIIQNTIGLRCNDLCNSYYLFQFLKVNKQIILNKNRGSAQPNVKVSDLLSIKLSLPNINLLKEYEKKCKLIFNQVNILGEQTQTLKSTRDLLLPRLISGKLSVEDLH